MEIKIIKFEDTILSTAMIWTFSNLLDNTIVNLQESLNESPYQPLLIYSGERRKYKNINKKYGVKYCDEIDFSKIKENIIILNNMSIFTSQNPYQQLNKDSFKLFISSCKDNNIDLILSAQVLLNEIISIISDLEIKTDFFIIKNKSDMDSLYRDIRRTVTLKYIEDLI